VFTHRESPTRFTVVCEHVKQFKRLDKVDEFCVKSP
jgi:hypothetical protein